MQLTAIDLTGLGEIIIILKGQEVEVELFNDFSVFDDQFNEVIKQAVIFRGRQDSWFCPSDQAITLNEQGKGSIDLTEGDEWDIFGGETLPIEIKVVVPLTAEILLKKRIGIL